MTQQAAVERRRLRDRGRGAAFRRGLASAWWMIVFLLLGRQYLEILTPVELTVDRLVPRLPMGLFERGIEVFGGYAKPLFSAGAVAVLLGLCGLVGVARAELRGREGAARVAALLGALGLVALFLLPALAWSQPGGARSLAVPFHLAACGVFAAALLLPELLSRRMRAAQDPDRRELIGRAARTGGLLLLAAAAAPTLLRLFNRLTLTAVRSDPGGMPAPITSTSEFYAVSKNLVDPDSVPQGWKLTLAGLVDEPYQLSLDDLRKLPVVEQTQTLVCISNEVGGNLIGNAEWKGVRLRDLLERAKVRPGTVDIKLRCADGYTESIPLAKAMDPGVVLAYEMNGAPLNAKHGAPARLLVPDIFGMKNAKWIGRIEAVGEDYKGYWQGQGWSDVATIQTMSQLRVPDKGTAISVGRPVQVGGVAFAGARGVTRVEWSVDGGSTWREARLREEIAPYSWRLWEAEWTPERAGDAELVVRATDGAGDLQTADERDTLPDGATGYHSIRVRVDES